MTAGPPGCGARSLERFIRFASTPSLLPDSLPARMSASVSGPTVTVEVGAQSTSPGGVYQFNPPTISAPNGTVVSFRFSGIPGNHSVTQSTFVAPCAPLKGGFDSGFMPGRETKVGHFPTWNYPVTDDSNPMWFFCQQQSPTPHCNAGMVGVINVGVAQKSFQEFQAKAEGVSVATTTSVAGASSSTGQGSSSGTLPSNALHPQNPVPVGAIVGATIAAVLLVSLLIAFLVRRRQIRRHCALLEEARPDPLILSEKEPLPEENTLSVLSNILREIRSLRRPTRRGPRTDRTYDPPPEYPGQS
ncbi:hypothetical protein FB451DRAFT_1567265 [Mycena latifolia]|nr:hypothetical protein FB451DRAFT_1567265 [Mycena latifolia]